MIGNEGFDPKVITKENVNQPSDFGYGTNGRVWIDRYSSDDNLEEMRRVMSLKPNMILYGQNGVKLPCPPFRLMTRPMCLQVYIEMGGDFKDFFHLFSMYSMYLSLKTTTLQKSIRLLFEHGAKPPPSSPSYYVPLWVRKLYESIKRPRQHCKPICAILCGMRKWNASRSPLLNRTRRDVLSIIIKMVWNTRFQKDWGIRKSARLKRIK